MRGQRLQPVSQEGSADFGAEEARKLYSSAGNGAERGGGQGKSTAAAARGGSSWKDGRTWKFSAMTLLPPSLDGPLPIWNVLAPSQRSPPRPNPGRGPASPSRKSARSSHAPVSRSRAKKDEVEERSRDRVVHQIMSKRSEAPPGLEMHPSQLDKKRLAGQALVGSKAVLTPQGGQDELSGTANGMSMSDFIRSIQKGHRGAAQEDHRHQQRVQWSSQVWAETSAESIGSAEDGSTAGSPWTSAAAAAATDPSAAAGAGPSGVAGTDNCRAVSTPSKAVSAAAGHAGRGKGGMEAGGGEGGVNLASAGRQEQQQQQQQQQQLSHTGVNERLTRVKNGWVDDERGRPPPREAIVPPSLDYLSWMLQMMQHSERSRLSQPGRRPRVVYDSCHAVPLPKGVLAFSSHFEGGNLRRCTQVGGGEFDLLLDSDTNTNRHMHWFFFAAARMRRGETYRFNIVNLGSGSSPYNEGLRPMVYSTERARKEGVGWSRGGSSILYYASTIYSRSDGSAWSTLTFSYRAEHDNDTILFAQCYPYTYVRLRKDVARLLRGRASIMQVRPLCTTPGRFECPLVRITANNGAEEDRMRGAISPSARRVVVVIARARPGETPSSYMAHGLIEFLSSQDRRARDLRDSFIFYVVSMLNPDGVAAGNSTCNMQGHDPARAWLGNQGAKHSTRAVVDGIKRLVEGCTDSGNEVALFLELRCTSARKNVYCIGCGPSETGIELIFPKILSNNCSASRFMDSRYDLDSKSERGSARRVMHRQFGVACSYEVHASMLGGGHGEYDGMHYSSEDYARFGMDIGCSVNDWHRVVLMGENLAWSEGDDEEGEDDDDVAEEDEEQGGIGSRLERGGENDPGSFCDEEDPYPTTPDVSCSDTSPLKSPGRGNSNGYGIFPKKGGILSLHVAPRAFAEQETGWRIKSSTPSRKSRHRHGQGRSSSTSPGMSHAVERERRIPIHIEPSVSTRVPPPRRQTPSPASMPRIGGDSGRVPTVQAQICSPTPNPLVLSFVGNSKEETRSALRARRPSLERRPSLDSVASWRGSNSLGQLSSESFASLPGASQG